MIKGQNGIIVPKTHLKMGCAELREELFTPAYNEPGWNKPKGGIWVSTKFDPPRDGFICPWHEWCYSEQPDWIRDDIVEVVLKDNSKIFVVNDRTDLKVMLNAYGEVIPDWMAKMGFRSTCSPNYEAIAEIYDGIYLTEEGQWKTRSAYDTNTPYLNLYGWDCESLVILNWNCIESTMPYKTILLKREDDRYEDTGSTEYTE